MGVVALSAHDSLFRPCRRRSGSDSRRAKDAADVASILNATHEGRELFVPYTAETLGERLGRAPGLYSWRDVTATGNAVVGAWQAPEVRIRTEDGLSTRSRRVTRDGTKASGPATRTSTDSSCANLCHCRGGRLRPPRRLHERPSPTSAPLLRLAESVERYHVIVPFMDPPKDIAERRRLRRPAYF